MNWLPVASLSAFLSASVAVGQKVALRRYDSLALSFLLSALTLLLSAWIPFVVPVLHVDRAAFAILVFKSVLDATATWLVVKALQNGDLGATLPLLAISPGLLAIVAHFVLAETLVPVQWFGLSLMGCGTYLLEARGGQGALHPLRVLVRSRSAPFLAVTLVVQVVATILGKVLVGQKRIDPLAIIFIQHVLFATFFAVATVCRRRVVPTFRPSLRSWALLLAVAVMSLGSRYSQLWAFKYAPVALVSAVKRTSILYATGIGGRFLSEPRLAARLVAGLLIVAGGFVLVLSPS